MDKFLDVCLDAVLDTLKIVPILLLVYFLIEFLEYKNILKCEKSKMLNGKASPIFGSLFGSLPQCGFSVVSTDLYTKGFLSIGALLAVYIATSDEALPIMLSHKDALLPLLALIICKIILGILIGYFAMWLYPKVFKVNNIHGTLENLNLHTHSNDEKHTHDNDNIKFNNDEHDKFDEDKENEHHIHSELESVKEVDEHEHIGCCNHDLESQKFDWKHPLLHCLKITAFILIVNLIFGIFVMWIGQDNLTKFLLKSSWLQPLLAVLIGLIPNCASSVVITELYLLGGLSFGSILAGLSVNAGLGLVVLFKKDKNPKEIAFILSMLIIPSIIIGYLVHLII